MFLYLVTFLFCILSLFPFLYFIFFYLYFIFFGLYLNTFMFVSYRLFFLFVSYHFFLCIVNYLVVSLHFFFCVVSYQVLFSIISFFLFINCHFSVCILSLSCFLSFQTPPSPSAHLLIPASTPPPPAPTGGHEYHQRYKGQFCYDIKKRRGVNSSRLITAQLV